MLLGIIDLSRFRGNNTMHRVMGVLITVLVAAPTAGANVGPSATGGQVAGEPLGIRNVRVEHETLIIDLRPIANNEKVQIQATYHLHNTGPKQTLELLFASGTSSVEAFEVHFDEQLVPTSLAQPMALPESWKPPRYTPGFDDRKLDYAPGLYSHGSLQPIQFKLTVPPGQHTLRVRYQAQPGTNLHGFPTVYRQFAYVLAPARMWDGFGTLEVSAHVPPQWAIVISPELIRDGTTLRGTFAGIPDDSLSFTLQAQSGPEYQQRVRFYRFLFWITAAAGIPLACLVGRWIGFRKAARMANPRPPRIWPISVVVEVS